MIGAAFLTASSFLAAVEVEQEQFVFYLASAANGIQNGISSIYSKNLIRSTGVTGTTTDIGILLGQLLRGNKANTWRLIVLCCLFVSFWFGGLISLFATNRFLHFSLLFNAGLYTLIGGSVVVFLRAELTNSWGEALFGKKLEVAFEEQDSKEPKSTHQEDSSLGSPRVTATRVHNRIGHGGLMYPLISSVDKGRRRLYCCFVGKERPSSNFFNFGLTL